RRDRRAGAAFRRSGDADRLRGGVGRLAARRVNTRDNTPAVVHVDLVQGNQIEVTIAAKGGGSENKARFTTLNPSASVSDWVVNTVSTLGSGWCPPGLISVGIGGSAEKAMLLAKEAMNEPIDMAELIA
ncbi:fumarate hydratase, partial [Mesorhizobium sp. M4B.F.Ca.ET.214.01.1.1]|uniref:fumarate hydratase n=1 Tax=Mesorhizobium sp. M4B.F.Ca.ET.214.01.1.1 TaxID=2563955 RepID=UPI001FDFC6E6